MSSAFGTRPWKARTAAFNQRPGAKAATRDGGATNKSGQWKPGVRWENGQAIEVKLTPAQQQRVEDLYWRQLKGTVGLQALWHHLADHDDPLDAPDRGGISFAALRDWYRQLEQTLRDFPPTR